MTATAVVYSPYAYEIHDDPYPTYRRLRDEAPVYRNEADDFWALSRHADVVAGFRDSARFSSAHGVSLDPAASGPHAHRRSEEHTSELQSLMRISYAVFCLKKK